MIQNFTPNDEFDLGKTTGCSCCSGALNDKEEVLKEARENLRIVKEVCEFYKVPLEKFGKEVLTEKKCKKHKPYQKWSHDKQLVCWKCDKYLNEEEE